MQQTNPLVITSILFGAGILLAPASAQILVSAGSPYTQNFDALGTVSNGWTDNVTLPGWYASQTKSGATVTGYRAGSGSSTAGSLYSYGVAGVNSITDRALGSLASGTPGNLAYGVRFQNDTTQAMADIVISYTGEQWRNGGAGAVQTLAFSYLVSNNPITGSDAANANAWVPFASLSFNSPIVGSPAGALDGHAAANQQTFSGVLLFDIVVYPGQEVFFRWYDTDDSGNDDGLAIDDLSIAFTLMTAVTNPPAIDPRGQPQSRTNNAGTVATLSVVASGTAPTYQWQLNGAPLFDGFNLSGTATPTLTISNVLEIDAGTYTVVVANDAGSVTSDPAVLTVLDPAVSTQPLSRTNIAGDTADFYVRAAGTGPLSYQWQFNGTDLADATSSSLNLLNVQSANEGSYSVVVANANGDHTTSLVATLTLLATPAYNLARWDFNATNSLDATAPAPSLGNGTASLLNGVTASFSSGTYSDPAGTPGWANSGWNTAGYPPQGTSNKTAGVQFNVSTLGYQHILLAWEQRHSNTASKYARLQYTTDGANFLDGDLITMTSTNNGWVFYVSDLSAIPGVNDNPSFAFRIVSEWEATAIGTSNPNYVASVTSYGTSGTMRFDLVGVYGDAYGALPLAPTVISNLIGTSLTYGSGSGSQFVLLRSTNPSAPLSGWTHVHTNFTTPGTFAVPTGSGKSAFYIIKSE